MKQRWNPRLVEEAKNIYNTELPKCLSLAKTIRSTVELEQVYETLKDVRLSTWETSREKKPK